jgi:hypothetical protein
MALTVNEEIYYRNLFNDFGMSLPATAKVDVFDITSTVSTRTLTATPASSAPVFIRKNNILLRYTTDYTISGTTVTFVSNLINGDTVIAVYEV